jgi:carbamate kinase
MPSAATHWHNLKEQMQAVKVTATAIADLIEQGHEVVISHGNGPQVGSIQLAMEQQHVSLSMCVAMSQAYIGYDLQNALREELLRRNIYKPASTVITQVIVDQADPAFKKPTKPIGRFLSKAEADELAAQGMTVMEDAGRGWRRVVATPRPKKIVEIDTSAPSCRRARSSSRRAAAASPSSRKTASSTASARS